METDDFEQKAGNIRQLASMPPDQLTDHLSAVHPHIDQVAPNVAPHVFSAATNAIQFLNSKLPNSGNELLQDKIPEVSQAQKTAWLNLHKTVSDPTSVFDHINNGTLNSHHLEALQSVYPDLHQEMIQKSMEHLGIMKTKGEQLPYQKRVSISKFIGQPLDSTMTPDSFQAILRSAGPNSGPAAQGGPKKATGVTLNAIQKANKIYETPEQSDQLEKNK
jgi:hypothetical protein